MMLLSYRSHLFVLCFMQLSFKSVKNKTNYLHCYLYLPMYLPFPRVFFSFCGFELPLVSFLSNLKSFNISCKTHVLSVNSLCLSGNVLISLLLCKTSFAGYRILSWLCFSFSTLNMSSSYCSPPVFLMRSQAAVNLTEVPSLVHMGFSLPAF